MNCSLLFHKNTNSNQLTVKHLFSYHLRSSSVRSTYNMGIGNSNTSIESSIKGSGSNNEILLGDLSLKPKNGTIVQGVMETAGKTVNRVIESGGDIITAPAVWLKDMQQNWLTYMVVAAIILSILLFFYCLFCIHLPQKKNHSSSKSLIELAKIISHPNTNLQRQQSPSSVLSLPSVSANVSAQPQTAIAI